MPTKARVETSIPLLFDRWSPPAPDLTTRALYHYLDSKRDLYLAVFHEAEEFVFARLRAAAEGRTSLAARIEAMLAEIVRLGRADPTLARFMRLVKGDVSREDLREARQVHVQRDVFFRELVDDGVPTGSWRPGTVGWRWTPSRP